MNIKDNLSAADKSVQLCFEFETSIKFSNKYDQICDLFLKSSVLVT